MDADIVLVGETDGDCLGTVVEGGTDVDSDGHDDLLVAGIGRDTSDNEEVYTSAGGVFLFHGPLSSGDSPHSPDNAVLGNHDSQGLAGTIDVVGSTGDGDQTRIAIGSSSDGSAPDDACCGAVHLIEDFSNDNAFISDVSISVFYGEDGTSGFAGEVHTYVSPDGRSILAIGAPGADRNEDESRPPDMGGRFPCNDGGFDRPPRRIKITKI